MGEIQYFTSEKIAENSWMIKNNFGDSTPAICYLIEGENYALLIDSIIGIGNLKKFCETLTKKTIKLVNTHAHSDHVGGNFHFEECYMHHRDIGFFQTVIGVKKEEVFEITKNMAPEDFREKMVLDDNFADWNPMKTYPIYDGDEFDLGDRIIEVVEVLGHTEGSIVLIDHKTRICYAGDACNSNTLLDLPTSLPVETYYGYLKHLKDHQPEFDMMYCGHEFFNAGVLDEALETVATVLDGTDAKCERIGIMGTPVLYAAEKIKDGYPRVDGKRFNMSYLPDRIKASESTKQIIKK